MTNGDMMKTYLETMEEIKLALAYCDYNKMKRLKNSGIG